MRRIVLSIALAVSLSALHATPAAAHRHHHAGRGLQKAPIWRVRLASLKTADNVTGEVGVMWMSPDTTYNIAVLESPTVTGPWTPIVAGTLTTNNDGNGNLAINVERIPGSTAFSVAVVP